MIDSVLLRKFPPNDYIEYINSVIKIVRKNENDSKLLEFTNDLEVYLNNYIKLVNEYLESENYKEHCNLEVIRNDKLNSFYKILKHNFISDINFTINNETNRLIEVFKNYPLNLEIITMQLINTINNINNNDKYLKFLNLSEIKELLKKIKAVHLQLRKIGDYLYQTYNYSLSSLRWDTSIMYNNLIKNIKGYGNYNRNKNIYIKTKNEIESLTHKYEIYLQEDPLPDFCSGFEYEKSKKEYKINDETCWDYYDDNLDMDQQGEDFWNQF
jgi:hypothetical protein